MWLSQDFLNLGRRHGKRDSNKTKCDCIAIYMKDGHRGCKGLNLLVITTSVSMFILKN